MFICGGRLNKIATIYIVNWSIIQKCYLPQVYMKQCSDIIITTTYLHPFWIFPFTSVFFGILSVLIIIYFYSSRMYFLNSFWQVNNNFCVFNTVQKHCRWSSCLITSENRESWENSKSLSDKILWRTIFMCITSSFY